MIKYRVVFAESLLQLYQLRFVSVNFGIAEAVTDIGQRTLAHSLCVHSMIFLVADARLLSFSVCYHIVALNTFGRKIQQFSFISKSTE